MILNSVINTTKDPPRIDKLNSKCHSLRVTKENSLLCTYGIMTLMTSLTSFDLSSCLYRT